MNEIWKDITNTKGYYSVSSKGQIRSNRYNKIMKPKKTKRGYIMYSLHVDGDKYEGSVHRLMGYEFLGLENGSKLEVGHVNGDNSDNRVENLRLLTHKQNNRSKAKTYGSSKYRGVHWDKKKEKWVAMIKIDKKNQNLGSFNNESIAAACWNCAAAIAGYSVEALNDIY